MKKNNKIYNNRYKVIRKLGEGGTGAVFLVEDLARDSRRIAMKTIRPDRVKPKIILGFKREFVTLCKFNHPNLIKVFDFGILQGKEEYFFTLEYIKGKNILEHTGVFISQNDFEPAYSYAIQICRALEYIHSRGYIHYDIKPHNILVTEDNIVKVMDFGLVGRELVSRAGKNVRGTIFYIAPELFRKKQVDRGADLYSLGVVLHQALTRRLPFVRGKFDEVVRQKLEEELPNPYDINNKIPKPLCSIVHRLCRPNPLERYFTANDVIRAINQLSGSNYELETKETRESYILSGTFVGRQDEYKVMLSAYDKLLSNKEGSLIIINGESGIGKSRLLREFKYYVQLHKTETISIDCSELSSTPYGSFKELASRLISTSSKKDTKKLNKDIMSHLELISSQIASLPVSQTLSEIRSILIDDITTLINESFEEKSLLLFIENIHFADEITIRLLTRLSSILSKIPVITAVTYTDSELVNELNEVLPGIQTQDNTHCITLKAFNKNQVTKLLASMLSTQSVPKDFSEKLYRETGGHPFFLIEVLKVLTEREVLTRTSGKWIFPADDVWPKKIPGSIHEAVIRRLDRLDLEAINIMFIISIFNRPVTISELSTIAEVETSIIISELEMLVEKGLLESKINKGETHYSFVQLKVREVIYRQNRDDIRKAIHITIGKYLENKHKDNIDEYITELAYHYIHCVDCEKGFYYAVKAGNYYKNLYYHRKAMDYYNASLNILANNSELRKKIDPLFLVNIYSDMGDIYEITCEYDMALKHYYSSLRRLDKLRNTSTNAKMEVLRAELYRKQGKIYEHTGDTITAAGQYANAVRILEQWCGEVPDGKVYLARGYYDMGWLSFKKGDYNTVKRHLQDSRWLLEGSTAIIDRAEVFHRLGIVHGALSEYSTALDFFFQSLAIREKIHDLRGMYNSYNHLAQIFFRQGDYLGARQYLEKAVKICDKIGDTEGSAVTTTSLAEVCIENNKYKEAFRHLNLAVDLLEKIGSITNLPKTYKLLGEVLLFLGEYYQALDYAKKAADLAKKQDQIGDESSAHILMGALYERFNKWSKAEKHLNKGLKGQKSINIPSMMAQQLFKVAKVYEKRAEKISEAKDAKGNLTINTEDNSKEYLNSTEIDHLLNKAVFLYKKAIVIYTKTGETALRNKCEAAIDTIRVNKSTKEETAKPSVIDEFDYLESLNSLSKNIKTLSGLKSILEYVLIEVVKITGVRRGFIMLYDRRKEATELKVSYNLDKKSIKAVKDVLDENIISKVISTGKPIVLSTGVTEIDTLASSSIQFSKVKSVLCLPLAYGTQTYGAMYLDHDDYSLNYDDNLLSSLSRYLVQVSLIIANYMQQERIQSILKVSQQISSELDITKVFDKIVETSIKVTGADRGLVVTKNTGNEDANDYIIKVARNFKRKITIDEDTRFSRSILERAVNERKAQVVADLMSDHEFSSLESIMSMKIRSLICVPMIWQDTTYGAIYLDSEKTENLFDDETASLLEIFAAQAAISIENSIAYSKLKEAMQQLLHSERIGVLGQLVASTAHEILNPANSIRIGALDLKQNISEFISNLTSGVDETEDIEVINAIQDKQKEFEDVIKIIENGSNRIQTLVQNLRKYSAKDTSDKKEFEYLNKIIIETLELLHHELKYNINVKVDFAEIPAIPCYPSELGQVIMNLLINAIHAIESKGTIEIKTYKKGKKEYVQIKDNGCGIEKEQLNKIFDKFYTTKPKGVGTGLGLAICHEIIVKKHNGTLKVDSKPGKSTTFTISLPINTKEKTKNEIKK